MLELALQADKVPGILQKEISENQAISVKYLDHIIADLKAAGLVANVSGKKSGYMLSRPAEEITVFDIYLAFEDDLAILDCLTANSHCPREKICVLKDYWYGLNQTIRKHLESQNLKDLVEKAREAEDLFSYEPF